MFDTGATCFMLVATSFVMLMTPGLAFFYGGLAGRRNIVGIMVQSFISIGVTSIMWFICGYSLSFSGGAGLVIGNLDKAFLHGVTIYSAYSGNKEIPELVFIAYQMMFAVITPALITGAFVNRVSFKAYLLFLILWQLLVYYPFAHMLWGGGRLAVRGILDFAGGIAVHNTAGFAALAAVFYIGKRRNLQNNPHSLPFIALGTALLWFGWFGFNAGGAVAVHGVTCLALLNTHLTAAFAAVTWLIIEWTIQKKPKFIGLLMGAVAGLVAITPAAGYISPQHAALLGIIASLVSYAAVHFKNKQGWDDTLDVWGVHGMSSVVGTVFLGVCASTAVNSQGADGLIYGGVAFFMKQLIATIGTSIYAFVFTYVMLVIINKITPIRVNKNQEDIGLDESIFGESAYK